MRHAQKAMKKRDVHLETRHSDCKLLKGDCEETFSIIHSYLYTQSPSEYADM